MCGPWALVSSGLHSVDFPGRLERKGIRGGGTFQIVRQAVSVSNQNTEPPSLRYPTRRGCSEVSYPSLYILFLNTDILPAALCEFLLAAFLFPLSEIPSQKAVRPSSARCLSSLLRASSSLRAREAKSHEEPASQETEQGRPSKRLAES